MVTEVGGRVRKPSSVEWHPINAAGVDASTTKSRVAMWPSLAVCRGTDDPRERIDGSRERVEVVGRKRELARVSALRNTRNALGASSGSSRRNAPEQRGRSH